MGATGSEGRSSKALGALFAIFLFLTLASPAQAVPFHARTPSLDVKTGLNHACGAAVDSKGDLYLSSAGESKVKVYNPSHVLLTEISDANIPCGLAVTTKGVLYVSERSTGEVVRFKPNAYPFSGTPTYGSREAVDKSGKAKGIAVDPIDNRLYVAAGDHIAVYKEDGTFEVNLGEGTLTEASGVASFSYQSGPQTDHFVWAADASLEADDRLYLYGGTEVKALVLRRTVNGSATPDGSFGFDPAGAYLAADPGNRNTAGECKALGEQACTAGHLFLYDAAHKALDEFDATGEYLDRTANASFADAEPSAVAVDRSTGSGDGTIYVTAGSGAGAKALAFGPLKAPSRATLGEPLSHLLKNARAVATDSHGDVYVVAEAEKAVRVFGPDGKEIVKFSDPNEAWDLAVDSTGKVYVLDKKTGLSGEGEVTYYTPSKYPPDSATTYLRNGSPVATEESFPPGEGLLKAIAVNPEPETGPQGGEAKDHLYITSFALTYEYTSAASESELINEELGAECVKGIRQSMAVDGARGILWIGVNPHLIYAVDPATGQCLHRFENTGASNGKVGFNPFVAVDQANGHVVEFDATSTAREYDGAGSFVAQFGNFTEGLSFDYRVAVDSSCAIHEPPLTGKACEEYDPANGNAYVAFDDPNASHPPYDVTAFGPLKYPEPPKRKLTVEKKGTGSGKVTSSPEGIDCGSKCSAEFLETDVVTLTAVADAGSEFVKWTGCEAEPSPTKCEVTMSEDRKVVAEFTSGPPEEELEIIPIGPGSGTVTSAPSGIECPPTCKAEFGNGVKVILTAMPDKGSEFVGWTGCEAETVSPTEGTCEVTMSEDRKVEAEFDVGHPLLSVTIKGVGSGEVTSDEPGIECPPECSAPFDLGDEVTLTAVPDEGSEFVGWGENDCEAETVSPTEGTCEVTMDEAKSVVATFVIPPQPPQVEIEPAHPILYHEATLRGEVDPSGSHTEYRFEYLTEEEYEEDGNSFDNAQRTPIGELEPGEGSVPVEAALTGLEEGTRYRFRLVAMNSVGPANPAEGPPFETLQRRVSSCANAEYRIGLSTNLSDCRAYELVTPAQTDGLFPYATLSGTSPSGSFENSLTMPRGQAAGERLSYFTDGTLPGFEGNGILDGYRAERGAGSHPAAGWQSALFSPDYAQAAPGTHASPFQLGVASDQLYSSWEINHEPETFPQTLEHGVYLSTPTGFEALGQGSLGEDLGALSRYVSAGGGHTIFSSKAHLEPGAPPELNAALYDRAAGAATAHVLTLPPDKTPAEEADFLAALRSKEQASFSGASEDGATVVFKAGVGLYVRLDDAKTEKVGPDVAKVGDTLRCAAGPLFEGSTELKRRGFQWLRDATPITGESGDDIFGTTDYVVTGADEGSVLQCLTVATDTDPRSVAVSEPVEVAPLAAGQAPRPPAQIAAPTPAEPAVGTVESCNAGSWEGAESLAYQWYVDGDAIPSANSQTYKVQAADVPGTLQCVVSGSNAAATVAKASGLRPTSPAPAEAAPVATAQAAVKTAYAGVSEDGRYVFFAIGNGASPGRLFRFDTQSESATEIAAAGIFAGIAADGSQAFFSSTQALSGAEENDNGEEATPGEHNLYAWDDTGTPRFVGTLPAADFEQGGFDGVTEMSLAAWTRAIGIGLNSGRAYAPTRSTPGGDVFVFQSHARLTAYDNEGRGEIYRYDPAAAAGERLLCVSCDPSGAPPSDDALLEDLRGVNITSKTTIPNLTDDGQKVFFQSFDRLLPEDANEVEDVYEWVAKETEGCTRSGGCLSLISSGQGEVPSFLYAMSADGRDVFFQTREKLVGADSAGSPSIYDAREDGGIPEPPAPTICQDDACQGQGSEPPVLPNPATTGAGESGEPAPPPRRPCAKGKHRVKGRCVPVKHRKHRKHRRVHHANRGGNR